MKTCAETATLLLIKILLLDLYTAKGRQILCSCSTQHCNDTGWTTCHTQYKCYIQYLDKQDGSNPITRGCISGRTPILCENRPPAASRHRWPYLICCDSGDFCNAMSFTTRAPMIISSSQQHLIIRQPESITNSRNASTTHLGKSNIARSDNLDEKTQWPIPQPAILSVLAIGLFLLVAIMGFGFYILKQQSNYMQQGFPRQGYLRAAEEESLEPTHSNTQSNSHEERQKNDSKQDS